jgi:hypothetical protein
MASLCRTSRIPARDGRRKSILGGYDKDRGVSNVVFDNVRIGGTKLSGPQHRELDIGPFVDGVTFK